MPLSALNLSRQIALVTGASSGIGRACAVALGQAGAAVVVNYSGLGKTSASDAEAVVAEITKAGGQAVAIRADVSQEEDVEAMFAETIRRFGTVHILVA